jgi:hypothetical protein
MATFRLTFSQRENSQTLWIRATEVPAHGSERVVSGASVVVKLPRGCRLDRFNLLEILGDLQGYFRTFQAPLPLELEEPYRDGEPPFQF